MERQDQTWIIVVVYMNIQCEHNDKERQLYPNIYPRLHTRVVFRKIISDQKTQTTHTMERHLDYCSSSIYEYTM
jgi:hypothetical protein